MDFSGIKMFAMMKARMKYLTERQGVLAQNIANANTPGFKAKELQKPDFSKMVNNNFQQLPLAQTNSSHIHGVMPSYTFQVTPDPDAPENTPSGNNVSLEDQMLKVNETSQDYAATTSAYTKMVEIMKLAMGTGAR